MSLTRATGDVVAVERDPSRPPAVRSPISASASSRCPLPSTPGERRGSRPPRTSNEIAVELALALEVLARAGRGSPTSDTRLLQAGTGPAGPPSSRRAWPSRSAQASSRPTTFPRRSTVIRSAISITSSSLWLMNTIDLPASRSCAEVAEQVLRLARGEDGRRLVEDQDLDPAVQRLQDLDALLLADREVLDDRVRLERRSRSVSASSATRASAASMSRTARPSSPRMMFSVTVNGSTSTKCWWTIPIPSAIASRGSRS